MNGRVYDPQIGRFMSADPIVQDPTDTQSLNRYSYVSNNPLSYTDPTGYFSLGNLIKTVIAVVVVVVAAIYGQGWVAGALGIAEGTATAVIAGAIGGAIAGGITGGGDLRSILVGAVSGAAFAGLGTADFSSLGAGVEVAAYGTTGGITSVLGGGEFQSGFLAAGFATLAGPGIDKFAKAAGQGTAQTVAGTAASAVAGGVGSVLGGRKFANGAVTGAFAYAAGRALQPANDNQATGEYQVASAGNIQCDCYYDNANIGAEAGRLIGEMTFWEWLFGTAQLGATVVANNPILPGPGGKVQVARKAAMAGKAKLGRAVEFLGGEISESGFLRSAENWLGSGY